LYEIFVTLPSSASKMIAVFSGWVFRCRSRHRPEKRLAREARPEAFEVALGLGDELAVGLHAGNVRLLDERRRRREDALFVQYGFDIRRHRSSSRIAA
jgi:hypothetical protein